MSISHRQIGNIFYLRLDPDHEIIASMKSFCRQYGIQAGMISGLGAVKSVTLGFFEPISKQYQQKTFEGAYEITSLIGNISTLDQEVYLHAHANFAGADYQVFGGHLAAAVVSATAEIRIQKDDGQLERAFNQQIGLNIYKF